MARPGVNVVRVGLPAGRFCELCCLQRPIPKKLYFPRSCRNPSCRSWLCQCAPGTWLLDRYTSGRLRWKRLLTIDLATLLLGRLVEDHSCLLILRIKYAMAAEFRLREFSTFAGVHSAEFPLYRELDVPENEACALGCWEPSQGLKSPCLLRMLGLVVQPKNPYIRNHQY